MKFKYLYSLVISILCLMAKDTFAQYPGGVSTGTTRGYKLDYYNGSYTSVTQFGAGTPRTSPDNTGYSNKITGTEFTNVDATNYAMEYTGILEITTSGDYTFVMTADDFATLYIDGAAKFSTTYTIVGGSSAIVNLTAGDHTIKIKYFQGGNANFATLKFGANPAGINVGDDVDGRFVRTDNSKMSAWYKASDVLVTNNYNGTGITKVNVFVNKAPDYLGNPGNLGGYNTTSAITSATMVNFNTGARLDGNDDLFISSGSQKALSYRGATKSMFLVNQYTANPGQSGTFMFYHTNGTSSNNQSIGIYKNDATKSQMAVSGAGADGLSNYTVNEAKLFGGFVDQVTGPTAPNGTNPLSLNTNGAQGTPANIFSNVAAYTGLMIKGLDAVNFPEAIYYPFKLSTVQEQKVNTYLAVKYGITLAHNYVNTSGTTVFDVTGATNTGYKNRIFGIGRELAVEGLNQKQSNSQMVAPAATSGYDFMVAAKGAISTSNALNTGVLADGDYLLFGDNNGALAPQVTEIPSTVSSALCAASRLSREWKVQITGAPGAITLRAGSATSGAYIFPGNAANVTLLIDTDNDGDFTTGTVTAIPATSLDVNGIATFSNVSLANGNVITYAWAVTSPGGVTNGLKLWTKANDNNLPLGNVGKWPDLSPNNNDLTRTASLDISKIDNIFNYNPAVFFGVNDFQFLTSNSPLGMNGINKYAEFYILRATGNPGLNFDELITLGGAQNLHRWENSGTNAATGNFTAFGSGTAGTYPSSFPYMANLGLYSNSADGTNAIFRSNGQIRVTTPTSANLATAGNFRIGTDVDQADGDTNYNSFYAPELIVYGVALTAAEIQRVNSYLGIKYSIPLGNGLGTSVSDYLASDGITKPWIGDAVYKNDIFGIGRDDCSGLVQKQSKAYFSGNDIVTFGLTKIATTNLANTGTFAANKQFVMIANDGGATTGIITGIPAVFMASSCNPYRMARTWKVKNTGNVTNGLQITIGSSTSKIQSNFGNVSLAINSAGDATFASGTTTLVAPTSINNGIATFDNVILPDGVVFTVVYTLAYPAGVTKPTVGTVINGVTHVNGLAYKMYTVTGAASRDLSTGFNLVTDVLRSTGYYANTSNFQTLANGKVADGFGIELTGKLKITTGASTYRFRMQGDEQIFFEIRNSVGGLVTTLTRPTFGTSFSAADVNLPAGDYDIIVRGAENTGAGEIFDLQWSTNSGGTYGPIPDANFFVAPQGPSAWFETDDNALETFADGTIPSAWSDLSGNNNHLSVGGATNPLYYNVNNKYIRNYNPSIYFTQDWFARNNYLNGFSYGKTAKSLIAVGANASTGAETIYSGFGNDAALGNFSMNKLNTGKLHLNTGGNSITESGTFYNSTLSTTNIISVQLSNLGLGNIYADGFNRLSQLLPNVNFNTRFNDNDQLQVGNAPDLTGVSYSNNLNEIIYYPWDLSAIERQKVNSYLAIKWGTTLDQTSPTNYLGSDGATVWNASFNTAFKYDITGIGRDDCGNLNQKQSTSIDGNDIVAIGRKTIVATNADNTEIFANNKSFLIFANNNAANSFSNFSTDVPAIGAACYKRLNREWLAQPTNTPGPISIVAGKQGLFTFGAASFKPVLLVSNTAGSYAAATVIPATRINKGLAYWDNVTISANQYFTFAFIEAGPGGVTTGLTTWFNSDYGAYTDVVQDNVADTDGDVVKYLSNLKNGAAFSNVQSVNAAYDPIYKLGSFNYNNGIYFDGANDVLASAANINTSDYRSTTAMTSVFTGSVVAGSTGQVFWYHDDNGAPTTAIKTSLERIKGYWSNTTSFPLSRTPVLTTPEIYTFTNSVATGYRLFSNLATVGSGVAAGVQNVASRFRIGSDDLTGIGSSANFTLGEFAIYSDDKGAASTLEMRKIHSYMATKYGFTLDRTAITGAYIASDGVTATYNHAAYWNRITGIGRDDCSAFEQKQSFSQEVTGALVKISNDAVNGLLATNSANTATFTADKSFLLFGDDNKAITWTGIDDTKYNGTDLVRLNRVWRVKKTGTVGTVYLEVPANTSSATFKLPASPTSGDPVYLLVSTTSDFKSPIAIQEMSLTGTNLSSTYNFADGNYYTFATLESCLSPAGITDGLTSWYKSTDLATGTIAPSAVNALVDSYGAYSLNRNATGVATVVAGSKTNGFNFNRSITLTGNAAFLKTGLSESSLFSSSTGELYSVGTTAQNLFALASTPNPIDKLGFLDIGQAGFRNGATASLGGVTNVANIYQLTGIASSLVTGQINGLTITGTSSAGSMIPNATGFTVGFGYYPVNNTYNNGTIAEAFTFNRALTTFEKQRLNTYLSIKYGQTLAHNYYAPNYDGTNAATTTLYDVSTNGNRVLGLGNHISGCFYQNQSMSSLPGSMLKISVDGVMNAENSQSKTVWNAIDQAYVIMGDDNGALPWVDTEKPALYASNSCSKRISREWKVTTTKTIPGFLITIPAATGLATTKLPAYLTTNATNSVYMVINDGSDFTVNGNQLEVPMTLNTTTNEWEANVTFDANVTKYFTFIYKPSYCINGVLTNPVLPNKRRGY